MFVCVCVWERKRRGSKISPQHKNEQPRVRGKAVKMGKQKCCKAGRRKYFSVYRRLRSSAAVILIVLCCQSVWDIWIFQFHSTARYGNRNTDSWTHPRKICFFDSSSSWIIVSVVVSFCNLCKSSFCDTSTRLSLFATVFVSYSPASIPSIAFSSTPSSL